ncbi:MAG: aminotransferase class I/II-fold pyridoxal phosphate-dependent enzyme [Oscillospiraceae bacterium]|jgi:arginine/lysine/ornithine decarboxylase|nr:aminotransferase class I/II-fold pyridoxal phosphate-dependent enzyme [Oscillospiraceae bacterium]
MYESGAGDALYERLSAYAASGMIPMHVPGHKRNSGMLGAELPYDIDVTELPGFDNLHDMRGVLLDTADLAAALYGCGRAFPLVNGSTCGLLAAVRAFTSRGDTVIMARNCHMSVYSAVELCGLKPVYITPETDGVSGITCSVSPESVAGAVADNPGCALIIITSPTYEGVVSDVAAIAEAARGRSIPLLVDEAHGAHLGFSDYFPAQAMREGADAAVVSLHKTLPALTQCALALVRDPLAGYDAMRRELSVFQTSSPSYVLLASIDRCLRLLAARGRRLFDAFEDRLRRFDARVGELGALRAIRRGNMAAAHPGFYDLDPGKIVISARGAGLTGPELAGLLRAEYRIETEMAAADYIVAVATVCDGEGYLDALADALLSIDSACPRAAQAPPAPCFRCGAGGGESGGGAAALGYAAGAVAAESVWAYPPGRPIIVAGEVITEDAVREIRRLADAGVTLRAARGEN